MSRQRDHDSVSVRRAEHEKLKRAGGPEALACALVDRAARVRLPVQGAYCTERLPYLLEREPELLELVTRFLVRLYKASPHGG